MYWILQHFLISFCSSSRRKTQRSGTRRDQKMKSVP
jgi:hypothetical protein